MENQENREKIQKLSSSIKGINKLKRLISKKLDYSEYFNYLKKECELNLRIILDKSFTNIELTDNEKDLIEKYMFFSLQELTSHLSEGPNLCTLELISTYGSGDFNKNELEAIKDIYIGIREVKIKK